MKGYGGEDCSLKLCPNDCSGNGKCNTENGEVFPCHNCSANANVAFPQTIVQRKNAILLVLHMETATIHWESVIVPLAFSETPVAK